MLTHDGGSGTYEYSVNGAESAIRYMQENARMEEKSKSATVADLTQPLLIEPTGPAAHTDLIADQKILMVAEVIRCYTVQDVIVRQAELIALRDAIDEALGKAARACSGERQEPELVAV